MTRKFRVYITDNQSGWVELEAEDATHAEEKAILEFDGGNVRWTDSTFEVNSVIEIDPETGKDITHT
jgi:hypothetical protein